MSRRYSEILPSAARTSTPTAVTLDLEPNENGVLLIIDVSAVAATPSITVAINGVDPISGNTYEILASPAITSVSTTRIEVGLLGTQVANVSGEAVLPEKLSITVTHADADSITYSIAAFTVAL